MTAPITGRYFAPPSIFPAWVEALVAENHELKRQLKEATMPEPADPPAPRPTCAVCLCPNPDGGLVTHGDKPMCVICAALTGGKTPRPTCDYCGFVDPVGGVDGDGCCQICQGNKVFTDDDRSFQAWIGNRIRKDIFSGSGS